MRLKLLLIAIACSSCAEGAPLNQAEIDRLILCEEKRTCVQELELGAAGAAGSGGVSK